MDAGVGARVGVEQGWALARSMPLHGGTGLLAGGQTELPLAWHVGYTPKWRAYKCCARCTRCRPRAAPAEQGSQQPGHHLRAAEAPLVRCQCTWHPWYSQAWYPHRVPKQHSKEPTTPASHLTKCLCALNEHLLGLPLAWLSVHHPCLRPIASAQAGQTWCGVRQATRQCGDPAHEEFCGDD